MNKHLFVSRFFRGWHKKDKPKMDIDIINSGVEGKHSFVYLLLNNNRPGRGECAGVHIKSIHWNGFTVETQA